jgi:hypothetical protein
MRVDSEFAGLLVAVGFLVLGFVSMPIGTWFVLGCLALGGAFALLLRFTPKRFFGLALGTLVIPVVAVLWWAEVRLNDHIVSLPTPSISEPRTLVLRCTGQVTGWTVGSIRIRMLIAADLRMQRELGCLKMSFCHVRAKPLSLKAN